MSAELKHEYNKERPVSNAERLNMFLRQSRDYRQEYPDPNLWRVANLAAVEIEESRAELAELRIFRVRQAALWAYCVAQGEG